jgi:hypothetical protein
MHRKSGTQSRARDAQGRPNGTVPAGDEREGANLELPDAGANGGAPTERQGRRPIAHHSAGMFGDVPPDQAGGTWQQAAEPPPVEAPTHRQPKPSTDLAPCAAAPPRQGAGRTDGQTCIPVTRPAMGATAGHAGTSAQAQQNRPSSLGKTSGLARDPVAQKPSIALDERRRDQPPGAVDSRPPDCVLRTQSGGRLHRRSLHAIAPMKPVAPDSSPWSWITQSRPRETSRAPRFPLCCGHPAESEQASERSSPAGIRSPVPDVRNLARHRDKELALDVAEALSFFDDAYANRLACHALTVHRPRPGCPRSTPPEARQRSASPPERPMPSPEHGLRHASPGQVRSGRASGAR